MRLAVFDIGTNSIHMLVVEIKKDLSFEILDHEKDMTRLGDQSFESRRLDRVRMERALEVIERFHKIAKKHRVRRTIAIATSAVREARNGKEFVRRIARRTGVRVRIISGEEEGRLIYLAARSSVQAPEGRTLVVDVGGGSVELILGDGKDIRFLESYKLGVARLTDHFLRRDPPSKKEIARLERFVEKTLRKPAKRLRQAGFSSVIGTAGTMINLASLVYQDEESRPLEFVNHFELEADRLEKIHRKLVRTDLRKRLNFPGLDPKRADIILAGSVLVRTLLRLLGADRITLSDKAVREGVILDFIDKHKNKLSAEPDEGLGIRERGVLRLARRCDVDESHANQVAKLALELFDRTARLHRLGARERELLKAATFLHDIGHYVSFRKHHRHSYYLIVNSDLEGFPREEIEIIALVARFHRKKVPRREEALAARIGRKGWKTVRALAAILRIADGLDRSHSAVVKSLEVAVRGGKVRVLVSADRDAELELWQAGERADFFERVFRRRIQFGLKKRRS